MKQNLWDSIRKVHFIGIGGIGVSALARMMLLLDKKVVGSDLSEGFVLKRIKKLGGEIFIGHKDSNLAKDTDIVIYSPAIKKNNPELIQARKFNIPVYSYPEALGLISKDKYTIAVSGTHGKTTTTAMIAEIMIADKKDPTVVVGSFLNRQKDNFVLGKSKYFIVEACEYKESFLNLEPDILVITNIDNDHLDYFKTIKNIQKAFAKLITKISKDGFIICNPNNEKIKQTLLMTDKKAKIIDYTREKLGIELIIPGEHNIQNAKAALAAAKIIGIKKEQIEKALKKFSGTWRRFEYKGKTNKGALVYDDYAHHPTEVKATLKAIKDKFSNKKIIVIFQPHLYSRTKFFLNDFAKSFDNVNQVIITDIYAAREKNDKSIHARDLAKEIGKYNNNVQYISNFSDIERYLENKADKNSVIITMGAGDVYEIGEGIIKY
ncbi:MAG: UDP-N-acetylmuramate--L-alanine ligase [Parcubacteria group bacterium]|nr:UDP-N-acetylmuramate--L-alanine ligase [Parcubacteria group bacterium]